MRSKVLALVICFFLMGTLTGCGNSSETKSTGQKTKKSVLTIAFSEQMASLNPFMVKNENEYAYLGYIYEPLGMPMKDGTVQPWLAKSWEYNKDEVSWTFKLDERAKWSDDVPVTADDVKYTFETSYANEFNLGTDVKALIKEITVIDDKTVSFKLAQASPGFLVKAAGTLIVPKHILSKVADLKTFQNPQPIGSGPFLFKEYKQKSHIDLVKNPNYWQGAPKIDEVLVRDFGGPENYVLPFLKGEIDILPEMSGQETLIPKLLASKDIKVQIDQWPSTWYIAPNHRKYPLDQLEVRKAMDIALDKQELIDVSLGGYAELPLMGYFPPINTKWADSSLTWRGLSMTQAQRVSEANSILDGLGFKKGPDGVRVTDKGTKMEYSLMCLSIYPSYVRAADMISRYYSAIGIKINVETKDPNTLFGDIVFNSKGGDKWELLLHGSTINPDPIDVAGEYAPDSTDAWYNANAFGWKDPEIQGLYKASKVEMDEQKRLEQVKQAQKLFADRLVVLTIGHRNHVGTYRTDKFTGWNPTNISYGSMIHPLMSIQNVLALTPKE